MNDPAARLEIVRPAVPVDLDGAVLAESWSNDTWLTGGSVLRVCWRGNRTRLLREATLLGSLPAAVPHATVLAAGRTEDLTWMALRRLPGERLDLVWPRLSGRERRDAVTGMAGALRALHGWKPPPVVREQLRRARLTPPELFDREHLTERVWLYDICFRIRQLCAWGRLDPHSLQDLADLTMHPRVRFP